MSENEWYKVNDKYQTWATGYLYTAERMGREWRILQDGKLVGYEKTLKACKDWVCEWG